MVLKAFYPVFCDLSPSDFLGSCIQASHKTCMNRLLILLKSSS